MSVSPELFAEVEYIHNAIGKQQCKSIAFTASQGGEGVTEVVLITAKRYAKIGKKVLIIDMNSFKPRLSAKLQVNWNITDFYEQQQSISILADNIDILPYPADAVERNMDFRDALKYRDMINFWYGKYDLIMFDTCPITRVNAANIPSPFIAACCDGNFVIVTPGMTKESNLLKAIDMLTNDKIIILGIIINDFASPPLDIQIRRTIQQRLTICPRLQSYLLQIVGKLDLLTGKFGR